MFGLGLTKFIPYIVYITCIIVIILTLFRNARFGLYLITLLIPLQNLMDKMMTFPFGKDILDILMLAILISIFLHKKKEENISFKGKTNFFILLIIPLTYSALWVGSFKLGLPYPVTFDNPQLALWKNFIILPLLFFATVKIIEDKKQMIFLLWIMLITLFLMDVYYYQNQKWVSHESFSYDKRHVGVSFSYLGPNEFAAFYAQMTMLFIGLLLTIKEQLKKIIYLCIICLNFYCILFLYSRGAYVAVVVGLLFYGIIKKRMILVILIALFFSWHYMLPNAVIERIKMTETEEGVDNSVVSRFTLWKEAIHEVAVNPVTGIGFGSSHLLGFTTDRGDREKSRKDIHNGYLEILLEQGIIGLSFIFYIFYFGFKRGWLLYRQSEDNFIKGLGFGFVGMVIACFVTNFFGDRWSYLNVMGYFWILLGLVVKSNQING